MNEDIIRHSLIHKWLGTDEDFFLEIDKTGGWPLGYTVVSFYHDGPGGDRYCRFGNFILNTPWWTTVCTSDDYYWWKISDTKKEKIIKEAKRLLINQLR